MSSEHLLAIDPGSNKTGVALFRDGVLVATGTFTGNGERAERTFEIVESLLNYIPSNVSYVVMEDPLLKGKSNNSMQRFIGALELALLREYRLKQVSYIHPQTVKKMMGAGQDKKDMAWAAFKMLESDAEKDILTAAIEREAFDETDAVAIGLTYLVKQGAGR